MMRPLGNASFPSAVWTPSWDCPLLYQYNHVLSLSWKIEILKTSYFHSLTETLEWSIVLWLVNPTKSLNGQ